MSAVYEMHHKNGCKCVLEQHCTRLSYLLSDMTLHSCMETMGSRAVATVARTSQVVPSPKLGASHAKARAKAEAGRSRNKRARKLRVSRARIALIGCSKIRVADSLGIATFAGRQATGQPTARRKAECKQCSHMMIKCFKSREEQEFRCTLAARWLFLCREMASPVTSDSTDIGMPHTALTFARRVECFFFAQA